ncbi:McrB family protein [Rhodohalobacter sp. 614A]|uniref:McrB family protein n=1 Tax=Rhodohalobacter sp. 614A TaxID=2908649 RepID=UPI001F1DEB4C|nr:AAA family ATPase [Rhodohalobacter sp. 614A]
MDKKFTWVQTHKELAQYLSKMEGEQKELIELLKEAGCTIFNDKNESGETIDLEEIDPFTFFAYINKYGDDKRLVILQNIAEKLNLSKPQDHRGLPSIHAQNVWFFPYKYDRKNDEIARLWSFFYEAINHTITNAKFADVLSIHGTGKASLTAGLFYIDPEKYLPINGPAKPYLIKHLSIDVDFKSYSDYERILNQVSEKVDLPFYEISHESWLWTTEYEKKEAEKSKKAEENLDKNKWRELVRVIQKIDDEKAVRKFFKTVHYVLHELDLNDDEPIIYASAIDNYVQFTIGSRYVTHLQRKSGKVIQGFYVDNDYLDQLKELYLDLEISDKAVPVEEGEMTWVYLEADNVNVKDFYDGILALARKGVKGQEKSQFRSIYPDKHNPWIAKVALDTSILDKLFTAEVMEDKKVFETTINYPLNTIFYGPPGTGKTYLTVKRAAEIVENRKIEEYSEAREIFNRNLRDTIEFITFHQNYSYEDFIQGLRPDIENNKELTFDRHDGIFKDLADRALKNLKNSKKPTTKKKSFEAVFNEYVDPLVQGEVEDLEVEMKRVSYFITAVTNRSIEFRKTSGGTDHTLSINTLRKMYEAESVLEIQGLSSYYKPLLDKLLELGKSPGETEVVERKNYVIIIDEINRANISRVFGELITLIEPDKRSEGEFALSTKLPSGEDFTVPSNLYIISTMNTADKSIALLDIALRRRFEFEAMYPLYHIPGKEIHDEDILRKINERIIKLKGHDFQIGHSYFMNSDLTLVERMNRKVIPLLLEYFMNDEKEVTEILKNAGLQIQENSWPLQINGRVDQSI